MYTILYLESCQLDTIQQSKVQRRKVKVKKKKKEESQFITHNQEGEHEENKQLYSRASNINYFS